ncbi:Rpn family recombination-promoting nuclease/putative transposase [Chamaesiphon sp. OTE_20_metabat_361]|uniref:Rpn family recombination-promoting nuclease/putative transposase n=1 Tax=Chamaesiphon sp. OTE_20_metabat_361 TaxID=2964689 RepID=UPI00286C7ADD|nr:Rpn family recombination-promoting nuclease/putative transposase [Chamaesiphon sp. OTE_20_metabat_361]
MRRDTIFYRLFQQLPTLLFELLPNPPENAAEYVFDAIEVKETAFRMDGVFIPPTPSGILYFCEAQFQLDELLYERMLAEISIYVYRHRDLFLDWQAVVIYPSGRVEQSRREIVRELLASGRITRVYLDELGDTEELSIELGLMVLTTLEGDKAKAEARRLIGQAQGSRDIINLVSTIVLYKFDNLSRDEVDLMLGIELQQTRVYRDAKAEGAVDGERSLVLKLLSRKLGTISPEIQAQVNSLTLDRVESLAEDLLDFTQMADLINWLDLDSLSERLCQRTSA